VADQKENIADRMTRSGRRKIIRSILRRILSLRQGARFVGEGLSQLAPVLDVIGDVALLHDIGEMTGEALKLKSETDAAVEFVNNGPYDLDQLRVSQDDESFPSFNEFKKVDLVKRVGPAGDGFEYHHIVEQNSGGDIPEGDLQSTKNTIRIPKLLHEEITSEFAKIDEIAGMPLRQTLVGKSFNERWDAGLKVLSRVGIINRD
jgi:hypothetical protein